MCKSSVSVGSKFFIRYAMLLLLIIFPLVAAAPAFGLAGMAIFIVVGLVTLFPFFVRVIRPHIFVENESLVTTSLWGRRCEVGALQELTVVVDSRFIFVKHSDAAVLEVARADCFSREWQVVKRFFSDWFELENSSI